MKCLNCGGPHRADECKAPKVDRSKRPCFKCGKPGHISAECRGQPAVGIHNVEVQGDQKYVHFGVMAIETVDAPKKGKFRGQLPSAPRAATMGDFLSKDVFSQLRASEEAEDAVGATWEEILDSLDAGVIPESVEPSESTPMRCGPELRRAKKKTMRLRSTPPTTTTVTEVLRAAVSTARGTAFHELPLLRLPLLTRVTTRPTT